MSLVVLHSYPLWLPKTQTWMHSQVTYLPERIEPHVVCEKTTNLEQFPVEHLHCLADHPVRSVWERGLRRLGVRQHLSFVVRVARKTGARVLHSHFGNVAWRNLGAARRAGLRHVVTFYGADLSLPEREPKWADRYTELFDEADAFLCEGPFMRSRLVELGCPAEKAHVHHLGVRIDEIRFEPRSFDPSGPLRVLICGTFREKKGIPYAMRALGDLDHPVEVTVIGDAARSADQPEKEKILTAAGESSLQPIWLGFQPHDRLFEEAYRHHVFLSPSVTAADGDSEGGAPVTILEFLASGMPVVSTAHCDIPNLFPPEFRDSLAPERSVEPLVARLEYLISERNWTREAQRRRAYLEDEFDCRVQGGRLAAHYEGLFDRRVRPCAPVLSR